MKKDGITYRRDYSLGWRMGDPATDIDATGRRIDYCWSVFVRIGLDERTVVYDGRPMLPGLTYISPRTAIGPWRKWRGRQIRSWYTTNDGGYVSKGIEHRV